MQTRYLESLFTFRDQEAYKVAVAKKQFYTRSLLLIAALAITALILWEIHIFKLKDIEQREMQGLALMFSVTTIMIMLPPMRILWQSRQAIHMLTQKVKSSLKPDLFVADHICSNDEGKELWNMIDAVIEEGVQAIRMFWNERNPTATFFEFCTLHPERGGGIRYRSLGECMYQPSFTPELTVWSREGTLIFEGNPEPEYRECLDAIIEFDPEIVLVTHS